MLCYQNRSKAEPCSKQHCCSLGEEGLGQRRCPHGLSGCCRDIWDKPLICKMGLAINPSHFPHGTSWRVFNTMCVEVLGELWGVIPGRALWVLDGTQPDVDISCSLATPHLFLLLSGCWFPLGVSAPLPFSYPVVWRKLNQSPFSGQRMQPGPYWLGHWRTLTKHRDCYQNIQWPDMSQWKPVP